MHGLISTAHHWIEYGIRSSTEPVLRTYCTALAKLPEVQVPRDGQLWFFYTQVLVARMEMSAPSLADAMNALHPAEPGSLPRPAAAGSTTCSARLSKSLRWLQRASAFAAVLVIATANLPRVAAQLPMDGWTAEADSSQTGNPASYAIDGDPNSFWHSQYTPTLSPLPHTITIRFGDYVNRVTGFTYLPRQDAYLNGNIGNWELRLSTDGTTFPVVAATGSFADTYALKTFNLPSGSIANAKALQIKATTEAGGRGPWTSAAEIRVLGTVVTGPQYNGLGRWGPLIPFPLVPVAVAMLPNRKVLAWSSFKPDNFGGPNGYTVTAIFNPADSSVTERTVSNTQHDMFCPGISMTANGDIIVTGGDNAEKTSIYRSATDTWTAGAPMNIPRGYQSTATLSNRQVFVLGGSWSGGTGGKNGEVWSPSTGWRKLANVLATSILTQDAQGTYRADNHLWLFGWSGATVFHAGPSKQMNFFTTSGDGSQRSAGLRGDDDHAMNGNAVMYHTGKILTIGGAPSYQYSQATNHAYVITLTTGPSATASVKKVSPMNYQRAFQNSCALPDGTVLVTGGQSYPIPFNDDTAIKNAELWDPITEKFTVLAPASTPRTYHSVALLLPDARVLTGGGGLCGNCGVNHFNVEIFTPPYLLNADGSLKARPTITVSTTRAKNGAKLTVKGSSALSIISIIRFGSSTHSVDTDQRRLELCGRLSSPCPTGTTTYQVTIPGAGIAIPGYYHVFGVNAAGVPSIARKLRVG